MSKKFRSFRLKYQESSTVCLRSLATSWSSIKSQVLDLRRHGGLYFVVSTATLLSLGCTFGCFFQGPICMKCQLSQIDVLFLHNRRLVSDKVRLLTFDKVIYFQIFNRTLNLSHENCKNISRYYYTCF